MLLLSKQKSNTRSKFKTLIIVIKINLRLKSQRAYNQKKRLHGSKKTRKDLQIKSISYCKAINNWKLVTRDYLIVKLQLVTILRSRRLMEHALNNFKVRLRISRKQMPT